MKLVQHMWESRTPPTELIWIILVILPKGNTYTWGIGLLEVLCKLVEAIIDTRINMGVTFHDALNGFRACRGTGMLIVELNMDKELTSIDQGQLLLVFLKLWKSYDTLDSGRTL